MIESPFHETNYGLETQRAHLKDLAGAYVNDSLWQQRFMKRVFVYSKYSNI
jgi:hypothetical protein